MNTLHFCLFLITCVECQGKAMDIDDLEGEDPFMTGIDTINRGYPLVPNEDAIVKHVDYDISGSIESDGGKPVVYRIIQRRIISVQENIVEREGDIVLNSQHQKLQCPLDEFFDVPVEKLK